jgi:hypothetical protein
MLTDRTSYLHLGSGAQHSFTQQMRQRGQATIQLEFEAGDTYTPTRGSQIYLYDQVTSGYVRVFWGLIQDLERRFTGKRGDGFIHITAVSMESVFDTIYATPVQYVNQTCGAIVRDLFSRFEDGCPVALGDIQDGAVIPLFNTSYEKISELFGQLATTSGFTWYVDIQSQTLFFGPPSAVVAPFVLTDADVLFESVKWKVNGADYRNWQGIKLNYSAFSHSKEFFVGAGQKSVTLQRPVKQVTNAWATLSTCNTAVGTFNGIPADGDTVSTSIPSGAGFGWIASHDYAQDGSIVDSKGFVQTVITAGRSGLTVPVFSDVTGENTTDGPPPGFGQGVVWTCRGPAGLATGNQTYTFKNVIDNTKFGQIRIELTAALTGQNLIDAINATVTRDGIQLRGVTYSLPTWENTLCNAIQPSFGAGFTGTAWGTGTGDGGGLNAFAVKTGGDLAAIALLVGFPVLGLLSFLFGGSNGSPAGSTAINIGHLLPFSTVLIGDQFILNGHRYTVNHNFTTDHLGNTPVTFTPPLAGDVSDGTPVYTSPNGGGTFILQQKSAGSGWLTQLAKTGTAFSWSASVTGGGSSPQGSLGPNEGATISLQVYELGSSVAAPGLAYQEGSDVLHLATPLNAGSNLNVEYTRADGNVIEVADMDKIAAFAAITGGTGKIQQMTDASSQGLISTSAAAGLQLAQEALAAYSIAPQAVEFSTYRSGLQAGMTLTFDLSRPTGYADLLNGDWVIEELTGELFPNKKLFDFIGHYHYSVRLINKQEIGSYLDFWEGLGGSGGGSDASGLVATTGGGLSVTPATPTLELEQSGSHVGTEPTLNLIPGANVTLSIVDNPGNKRIDATISVTGGSTGIVFNESILVDSVAVSDDYIITVNAGKPVLVNGA